MSMTLRLPPVREWRKIGSGVSSLTVLTTGELGTPAIVTDSSGNSGWEGGFEPFGCNRQEGTASDSLLQGVFLRLPGQWDNATWAGPTLGMDLYYNVHRSYELQTGRREVSRFAVAGQGGTRGVRLSGVG